MKTAQNGNVEINKFRPSERWRILRNIGVISTAFMLHFTAFHGTANLQSSVNSDASLGTFTLAAIYGSLLLSNIILPSTVLNWFGCKWTIAVSFIAYMPFIGAQFFPKAYTLLPAGFMVGLGGGPLWCAKCTYLSVIAEAYGQISNQAVDVVVTRFFGIFFMFYQMAQVWGNLISSTVLSYTPAENTTLYSWEMGKSLEDYDNRSLLRVESAQLYCGAPFCGESGPSDNPNIDPPEMSKMYLIAGIFLALMVFACLIVGFGVDSLNRYTTKSTNPKDTAMSRLLATIKHTKEPYQLLLLPATSFIGAEQAFMAADYNFAYVACAYGIKNIGYVMICFGVFNALAALATGGIVKITGRYPMMIIALILHLTVCIVLLTWRPRPDFPWMFFAMAAIWGTADAIWLVQVNALSGILFPGKEAAAYSSFRLWESTGSVIAYIISPYLCTQYKVYFVIVLLFLGMTGYTVIEILERKAKAGLPAGRDFELVDEKKMSPVLETDE